MLLTAGQAGDNPQLLPLVDGYFRTEQTSDGARDVRLLADKAYSHPSTRTALRRRWIKHTIPERDDQIARRKAKGSAGGRPPAFDAAIYKQRNTVERGFNRLKQWRASPRATTNTLLDLSRRRSPCDIDPPVRAKFGIKRHALATECELSATFRRNLAVERLRSDSQAAIGGRQIRCALCPMP